MWLPTQHVNTTGLVELNSILWNAVVKYFLHDICRLTCWDFIFLSGSWNFVIIVGNIVINKLTYKTSNATFAARFNQNIPEWDTKRKRKDNEILGYFEIKLKLYMQIFSALDNSFILLIQCSFYNRVIMSIFERMYPNF